MIRGIRVRPIESEAEYDALAPAWRELHRRLARRSLFLTHEWLDAAWQWRGKSADLHLLVCERAGELVGALPLARPHDPEGVPGRTLEFLTVPDTQLCDLLAARGFECQVATAVASHLARAQGTWDAIRLPGLRQGSLAREMFAPMIESFGARRVDAPDNAEAWVALDRNWATYYARRSRRLKKAASLAGNRLHKAGRVEVHWMHPGRADDRELARVASVLTAVSASSWKRATGYSLDRSGPQSFLQRLLARARDPGWISVWILELDGRPIATELQLVHQNDVYGLRADFDPAFSALSPGSHLLHRLLQRLFEQGYRRYLMGPGENAYKFRWCDGADPVHAISLYSPTIRGRALATWETRVLPAARRLLARDGPVFKGATGASVRKG